MAMLDNCVINYIENNIMWSIVISILGSLVKEGCIELVKIR